MIGSPRFNRMLHRPFRHGLMMLVMLASLLALPLAARGADDLLSSERWEDRTLGISLRPPLGTQMVRLSVDDAILRMGHPSGYRITVYVKTSASELTLEEVVKAAVDQAAAAATVMRKIEDPHPIKLGSLEASRFTFAAPALKPPVVLSQAFALLASHKAMIVELSATPDAYESAKAAFDQMLQSFQYTDPQEQVKLRQQMLADGQAWLESLKPEMIHKALVADQWLRIVDGKKDIGYMRITQRLEAALQVPGVRIDVQSRIILNNTAYDTLSNYFASDDMSKKERSEIWSVRTTSRPISRPTGKETGEMSWADTGVLSKETLSLTRESPQGSKPFDWDQLPDQYITQALTQVLPALLGPADKKTLAFYAYYANTGKLAFRTERVEASPDGSYRVYSRPTLEQDEQVSHFDASGKLIRRVLPGGQTLIPATAQEIATRWKLKP